MSRSGTWWIWMFWRVVMWPLLRCVLLDHVGEGVHLVGGDAAEGQLDADHLHVGLALAIDALLEPEADELVLRESGRRGTLGFVVEVVELALDDRDDVAGDVANRSRGSPACRSGPCPAAPCARSTATSIPRKIAKPDRDSGYLRFVSSGRSLFACLEDRRGLARLGHVAALGSERQARLGPADDALAQLRRVVAGVGRAPPPPSSSGCRRGSRGRPGRSLSISPARSASSASGR